MLLSLSRTTYSSMAWNQYAASTKCSGISITLFCFGRFSFHTDTRSYSCHILSNCEKHEVWTWQRHLYDASFQSFNDQHQCTTMNHISRIRKIINKLARIRLPRHQHEQQFSYPKKKNSIIIFFLGLIFLIFNFFQVE